MENDGRPPDSNEALTAAAGASKAAKWAKIKADNDKRKEDEAAAREAISAEKKNSCCHKKSCRKEGWTSIVVYAEGSTLRRFTAL